MNVFTVSQWNSQLRCPVEMQSEEQKWYTERGCMVVRVDTVGLSVSGTLQGFHSSNPMPPALNSSYRSFVFALLVQCYEDRKLDNISCRSSLVYTFFSAAMFLVQAYFLHYISTKSSGCEVSKLLKAPLNNLVLLVVPYNQKCKKHPIETACPEILGFPSSHSFV